MEADPRVTCPSTFLSVPLPTTMNPPSLDTSGEPKLASFMTSRAWNARQWRIDGTVLLARLTEISRYGRGVEGRRCGGNGIATAGSAAKQIKCQQVGGTMR